MIIKKIPVGKIFVSLLLIFTAFCLVQPAYVSAAKNNNKSKKDNGGAGLGCQQEAGKQDCVQKQPDGGADGGGNGSGAQAFDQCTAAQLKVGDETTCTKVTQGGDCGTGKVFNPNKECLTTLPKVVADGGTLRKGLQIVFGVAAGVALISLGIAAFNFATAATDFEKISRSKKAIVFALIGLAIALLAEAIVTTVISKL